MYISRNFEI